MACCRGWRQHGAAAKMLCRREQRRWQRAAGVTAVGMRPVSWSRLPRGRARRGEPGTEKCAGRVLSRMAAARGSSKDAVHVRKRHMRETHERHMCKTWCGSSLGILDYEPRVFQGNRIKKRDCHTLNEVSGAMCGRRIGGYTSWRRRLCLLQQKDLDGHQALPEMGQGARSLILWAHMTAGQYCGRCFA